MYAIEQVYDIRYVEWWDKGGTECAEFERLLRKVFGSKRDKVTGEWRRLHSEDHYYLQPSTNIIQVIKSRKMSWA
jgi:hypothetical protein